MSSLQSILKRHDIKTCTLKFKLIEYSSNIMIVANLKVYYEQSRRPFYYNEQSITLTHILRNKFEEFFNKENICFSAKKNQSSYINKYSYKLDGTLRLLKFAISKGQVTQSFISYIKHYSDLDAVEKDLSAILEPDSFAFETITTTDLLNHI